MSILRSLMIVLSLAPGAWMTFDGTRALVAGDYVTPRSGQYAGQLGPWATVLQAVGIAPRSLVMKVVFVAAGLLWLTAAVGFATRRPWGDRLLLVMAVCTLWYLPVGTTVSVLELIGLAIVHARHGA